MRLALGIFQQGGSGDAEILLAELDALTSQTS